MIKTIEPPDDVVIEKIKGKASIYVLTGCRLFAKTQKMLGLVDYDICRLYETEREDAKHLLRRCSKIEWAESLANYSYIETNKYKEVAERYISLLENKYKNTKTDKT